MGCRLHVAKKYDVQYASIEYFNYLIEEALRRVSLTPGRMLEIMTEYLNASDPSNNYLNFSFF